MPGFHCENRHKSSSHYQLKENASHGWMVDLFSAEHNNSGLIPNNKLHPWCQPRSIFWGIKCTQLIRDEFPVKVRYSLAGVIPIIIGWPAFSSENGIAVMTIIVNRTRYTVFIPFLGESRVPLFSPAYNQISLSFLPSGKYQ